METYVPTLKKLYTETIQANLQKQFGYKSKMQVPRIEKIVINQAIGDAVADKKLIDTAISEISMIAGQKAVPTYSRKDISNFKLRKGMPIGVRVTLRREKMYEFLERLICTALPRIRDFQGISTKFDKKGNFSFGPEKRRREHAEVQCRRKTRGCRPYNAGNVVFHVKH